MATIHATRTIAADPASVALLLAGPTATELFAAATPVLPAAPDADLLAEIPPPHRSGVGFATSVSISSGERPLAWGSLTIQPGGRLGTTISVALQSVDGADRSALQRWLTAGLAELASAAMARACAA